MDSCPYMVIVTAIGVDFGFLKAYGRVCTHREKAIRHNALHPPRGQG